MYFFMPLIEQKMKVYPKIYVFFLFFIFIILPLCLLFGISFIASLPILLKRLLEVIVTALVKLVNPYGG